MKHYSKNGIDFVTDLIWQKQPEKSKLNLKVYRNDCKFDFYCKTSKISTTYGFARIPRDADNNIVIKIKHPVSLAIYIIESVDVDADADQFICFKFDSESLVKGLEKDSSLFGYVFLFKGSVFPDGGEYIGTLDEVKTRVKLMAKKYGTKFAFIPDDVPFYNDQPFAAEAGFEIIQLKSKEDERTGQIVSASDYYFWHGQKKRKAYIARLKSLEGLTKGKKILIGFILLLFLALVGVTVYNTYFDDDIEVIAKQVVPEKAPTSYPAKDFINQCLNNFDLLFINKEGWVTAAFKCNLKNVEYNYQSKNGAMQTLLEMTNQKKIVFNQQSATLTIPLNLPKEQNYKSSLPITKQIDDLTDVSRKLKFQVSINQKYFEVRTSYSPIFLFNNNIISNLNLSEISMMPNDKGFLNWVIKGEFNGN